jgi:hypothetical protein
VYSRRPPVAIETKATNLIPSDAGTILFEAMQTAVATIGITGISGDAFALVKLAR